MDISAEEYQEAIERYKEVMRKNAINLLRPRPAPRFGKWQKQSGGLTPGGTPVYVCGSCGGSEHLYGTEYRKRKMICDECGSINSYPWEETIEQNGEWM